MRIEKTSISRLNDTDFNNLKFVVLKGIEGFGDRLQCMLEAITYAKTTKRILVLDWRDSSWSHEARTNSDFYFKINNVDQFSVSLLPIDIWLFAIQIASITKSIVLDYQVRSRVGQNTIGTPFHDPYFSRKILAQMKLKRNLLSLFEKCSFSKYSSIFSR